MYGDQLWFKDMADALREKYGKDYKKISNSSPPKCILTMMGWFDPTIKLTLQRWGVQYKIDNGPSKEVLGIEYTDCKKSF